MNCVCCENKTVKLSEDEVQVSRESPPHKKHTGQVLKLSKLDYSIGGLKIDILPLKRSEA